MVYNVPQVVCLILACSMVIFCLVMAFLLVFGRKLYKKFRWYRRLHRRIPDEYKCKSHRFYTDGKTFSSGTDTKIRK